MSRRSNSPRPRPRVPGAPRLVVLVTRPAVAEDVVAGCAAAGVPRVWLDRAIGPGGMSKKAVASCREHGIAVIPGAIRHG
jgi:CoA binding protein